MFIALFLVLFAYDVPFELLNGGRTLGKVTAGIRVVGDGGEPIAFLASAIRNIMRIVDFLPVFYAIGVDLDRRDAARPAARRPRGGHDRRARQVPGLVATVHARRSPCPPSGRDVGRVRARQRRPRRRSATSSTGGSRSPWPVRTLLRQRARGARRADGRGRARTARIPSTCSKASSSRSSGAHERDRRAHDGARARRPHRDRRASSASRPCGRCCRCTRRSRARCAPTTGIPCPFCGMTRACVAAAHGHVAQSLAFNPAASCARRSRPSSCSCARRSCAASDHPLWALWATLGVAVGLEHRVQPDVPPAASAADRSCVIRRIHHSRSSASRLRGGLRGRGRA